MKKIAIIACYIGVPHNYLGLFLKSVACNPTIDFILLGHVDWGTLQVPANMKVVEMTLEQLEKEIQVRLNEPTAHLSKPYKTGDFRPMFGEMFENDLLKGYDEWGYCDLDVVFGDLRAFLTDEKLEQYDKIYPLGHLSFYKNTPEINRRWRLPDARYDYHEVIANPEVYAFDEWRGIHNIYMRNKFPFYRTVEYASPTPNHPIRYRFINRSDPRYEKAPKNYTHQCFYWEDGHVYRAFLTKKDGKKVIETEEFSYMHFQLRRFPAPEEKVYAAQRFFCSPAGFFVKEYEGIPTAEDIDKYNPLPFGGAFGERCYILCRRIKKWFRRLGKKIIGKKGAFISRSSQVIANRTWNKD